MKFAGALLITVGILAIMFTIRKPPGAKATDSGTGVAAGGVAGLALSGKG